MRQLNEGAVRGCGQRGSGGPGEATPRAAGRRKMGKWGQTPLARLSPCAISGWWPRFATLRPENNALSSKWSLTLFIPTDRMSGVAEVMHQRDG